MGCYDAEKAEDEAYDDTRQENECYKPHCVVVKGDSFISIMQSDNLRDRVDG